MFSIIICTYNREKYLYTALQKMAENDFSPMLYEIVLVNNNSTDSTEEECRRFHADYPSIRFRYFVEEQQGLSHARNRGIREAKEEMLIFLDDDSFVHPSYLKNLSNHLVTHPEIQAFGGKIIPLYESGDPPAWLSTWSRSWVSALDMGDQIRLFKKKQYPVGANMGFHKSCTHTAGLFNTELGRCKKNLMGGEEKEFFFRLRSRNVSLFYLPDIAVFHAIPESRTTLSYVKRLGDGIGSSERMRCLRKGNGVFLKRCIEEILKWGATLLLWCYYILTGRTTKGNVLVLFRWHVSRTLFFQGAEKG